MELVVVTLVKYCSFPVIYSMPGLMLTLIAYPKQHRSERDADPRQAGMVADWGRTAEEDGARQRGALDEGRGPMRTSRRAAVEAQNAAATGNMVATGSDMSLIFIQFSNINQLLTVPNQDGNTRHRASMNQQRDK